MKVIVNFGEKKVVVPCGPTGDLLIRELIQLAINKYCKLSSYQNQSSTLNSDQVQLRLNNGAVVDPDDRVVDVVDDREELFAIFDSPLGTNGELTSSMTSSNLSTSLSEHEHRPIANNRHEVLVTDADLRSRSLRVKTESNQNLQSTPLNNERFRSSSCSTRTGMSNVQIDDHTGDKIFSVYLPKENKPLGIHVIPYNNQNEDQVQGLVLQTIEPDGRVQRQGILEVNDRIIEINRINIERCSFDKAQQIFRNALLESELELRIVRPAKKSSFFLNHSNSISELSSNSKRIGKLLKISLTKGPDGLGFKLASRDNPTGTANPIYVKTIFGKGAAIDDGRLCTGDRLLMVNSIDVTQMSLQETVGLLRETRVGETVHLCVSRQHDGSLPKDLTNDEEKKTQVLTFNIPLRDTSSAGLGITLKGKTSIVDGKSIDFGIFVKSVLTGGAAYRDNRLRPNDQILVINDFSLVNLSNIEAANILHDAVRKEIHPGYIKISVSRVQHQDSDLSSSNSSMRNVQETDLSPFNDENELDLINFVPSSNRQINTTEQKSTKSIDSEFRVPNPPLPSRERTTLNEKQNHAEQLNESANPFDRETPFRQSISEKRRLNQPANKQATQWKQQSFHEDRPGNERKNPSRTASDSTHLVRASSFESLPRPNEERSNGHDDGKKRQTRLRNRAWNESFRQAVDKSYGQTQSEHRLTESTPNDKSNKSEKQRFRFSNLFQTKSKRKENQEEKSTKTSSIIDDQPVNIYPPPPAAFSTREDEFSSSRVHSTPRSQPGYQPHRFDMKPLSHSELFIDSNVNNKKSSNSSHPPLPRQIISSNINGSQSLRATTKTSRTTLTIAPKSFNSSSSSMEFPINQIQQRTFVGNAYSYVPFESPANV